MSKKMIVEGGDNIFNCDILDSENKYTGNETVITDPPFNVGYHYDLHKDKMGQDDYLKMLSDRIEPFKKKVIIAYPEIIFAYAIHNGIAPEKTVSWVYNANTPKQHRIIAWFGCKPDFSLSGQDYKNPKDKRVKKLIENGRRARLYDWWEIQQVKNVSKEKTGHPCQMPLLVMDRIIKITNPDFVVDPFNGSGTTLVACQNNNVDAHGYDISENYCSIARNRLLAMRKTMEG